MYFVSFSNVKRLLNLVPNESVIYLFFGVTKHFIINVCENKVFSVEWSLNNVEMRTRRSPRVHIYTSQLSFVHKPCVGTRKWNTCLETNFYRNKKLSKLFFNVAVDLPQTIIIIYDVSFTIDLIVEFDIVDSIDFFF